MMVPFSMMSLSDLFKVILFFCRGMTQNDVTLTEMHHKSSETTSNDHNVRFKVKVNFCLTSNISKNALVMAIITVNQ